MKHQDALAHLARETKRAKRVLTLERAWAVGYWFSLAGLGWLTFALFGGEQALPPLLQSLATVAALIALVALGNRAWRAWSAPTDAEARARIARDSKFDVGAFDVLEDRPTKFDALSVALWRREQAQAYDRIARGRVKPAALGARDKLGIRFVLLALFAIAFVTAGDLRGERLWLALLPDPGPLLGDQPMEVEAWATPADYTHAAPISLSDRIGERIETPPSVEATVRVMGPVGAPRLVFEGQNGRRSVLLSEAADGAWEGRLALQGPGVLKVVRFHTRASWRIAPAPDQAPRAGFTAPLAQMPQERVAFSWRASDDFGVTGLALRVQPVHPPPGLVGAAPVDTPFESPAGDPREAAGEAELDLAAHPYAGMEVEARIVAFDALGQVGESEPLRFTLPEKVFLQPLARAAIEIRRHILHERRAYRGVRAPQKRTIPSGDILLGSQPIEIRDYSARNYIARAPEGVRRAARLLDALTMAPEDHYFRDYAVFLGLKLARAELAAAASIDDTNVAADILWRAALRAEYGGAADARRALEAAQQALQEALAQGAPRERIEQLMEALRRATDAYLQALVQEAIRNGETPQNQDDTQEQAEISQQDIQNLLQRVQDLSEQGRTAEAQRLLQMLMNLLSNLDARLTESQSGENGEQSSEQQQQMQQSMDQLSQTIGEQRALRDDTQQQQQQQSAGGAGGEQQGGQGGDDMAQRQAQIRQALGEAQRNSEAAGGAPSQELNAAEQAMQQSEGALRRGDLDAAQAAQNSALEHLREGAEQLAAQMRDGGDREGESGQAGQRDPLGRSAGVGDGDETHVPTTIDPARARDILNEIRRRAQDASRPENEREYLQRLLDRFSGS